MKEQCYEIITNPKSIMMMNFSALKYEYMFNKGFVASQRIDELEELVEFTEEFRGELEKLYIEVNDD